MDGKEIIGQLFFEKYKPEKKGGQGSFGTIYKGINVQNKKKVAMKFEKREKNNDLLETETYRMIYLKGEGIPEIYCYGNNRHYNILVLELLGKSLEDHFEECGNKLSLTTVCKLGVEMVKRIQLIHEKNHVHRDVKPDNFMTGIESNEDKIYIIDFGLAKKYRSSKTFEHIKFKQHKKLTGTIRYASLNASMYKEQSRRDDLEAIGNVLMYFLRGRLPWQGLKIFDEGDRYRLITSKKKETSIKDLCKGFPDQFVDFFLYCRNLGFEEEPKYDYLISLFMQVLSNKDLNKIYYDWRLSKSKSSGSFSIEEPQENNMNKSFEIYKKRRANLDKSLIKEHDISNDMINVVEDKNSVIEEVKDDNPKSPNLKPKGGTLKKNNTVREKSKSAEKDKKDDKCFIL